MKKRTRPSHLLLAGLFLISLGWASSSGLGPAELIIPVMGVVAGLTAITALVNSGPRALL